MLSQQRNGWYHSWRNKKHSYVRNNVSNHRRPQLKKKRLEELGTTLATRNVKGDGKLCLNVKGAALERERRGWTSKAGSSIYPKCIWNRWNRLFETIQCWISMCCGNEDWGKKKQMEVGENRFQKWKLEGMKKFVKAVQWEREPEEKSKNKMEHQAEKCQVTGELHIQKRKQ